MYIYVLTIVMVTKAGFPFARHKSQAFGYFELLPHFICFFYGGNVSQIAILILCGGSPMGTPHIATRMLFSLS